MKKFKQSILASLLLITLLLLAPWEGKAQNSLSLTVTPPLVQIAMNPGEFWATNLRIINTNPEDITVYPMVMNFKAEGESGHGKFLPILGENDANSLASWIKLESESVQIPKEKSGNIGFSIKIPEDASPGGHYAAILIGTKPFSSGGSGPQLKVSSFVSSLIFVRIGGEIKEEGGIREFSTDKSFYSSPKARFLLRFENRGNVHIQPQGSVLIYNMWGKERGKVTLNEGSEFGNVLPGTTRQFVFDWAGEKNLFEIGKYTAIATLTYGTVNKENVTRTISFWVIPIYQTAAVVGGFIFSLTVLILGVKMYIRKALESEMMRRGLSQEGRGERPQKKPTLARALLAPAKETILDLRKIPKNKEASQKFTKKYRLLVYVFIPLFIGIALWVSLYFLEVLRKERGYRVETVREELLKPLE